MPTANSNDSSLTTTMCHLWEQVDLSGRYVEVGGAAARVVELPFVRRHFSDAEAAAQARKGGKGSADTASLPGSV